MRTAGKAIVRLVTGAVYEGQAGYDGRAVTFDGHRRFVEGAERFVRLGPPLERTWPIGQVEVVEWAAE